MFDVSTGIDSLTNFKRQTAESLDQLHHSGQALLLTVNGKAPVVVQDAVAYQRLVEQAAKVQRDETIAAIQAGLADANAGRLCSARTALRTMAKKHGLQVPGK